MKITTEDIIKMFNSMKGYPYDQIVERASDDEHEVILLISTSESPMNWAIKRYAYSCELTSSFSEEENRERIRASFIITLMMAGADALAGGMREAQAAVMTNDPRQPYEVTKPINNPVKP